MRKVNVTAKSCGQNPYSLYTYWKDMLRGVFHMPALLDDWYREVCQTTPLHTLLETERFN